MCGRRTYSEIRRGLGSCDDVCTWRKETCEQLNRSPDLTRSGLRVCVAAGAKVQFLRAQPLEEATERLGSRHAGKRQQSWRHLDAKRSSTVDFCN
jgi:hypothetical protein